MNGQNFSSVFIDFENFYYSLTNLHGMNHEDAKEASISMIDNVLNSLNDKAGEFIIKQAFADWEGLSEAKKEIQRMGVRVIDVLSSNYKNSADIEMSLSIQEVVLTRSDIQTIVILAGDRDYMPIALRTRERGKRLYLVGLQESLSGDLKKLVGVDYYYYVNPENFSLYGEFSKEAETIAEEEPSNKMELSPDQLKAAVACIEAYDDYRLKFGSVKLSGFLVDRLSKALPNLDHLHRKAVFTSLVGLEIIRVTQKQSFLGDDFFSVFTVIESNELVQKIRKDYYGKNEGRE